MNIETYYRERSVRTLLEIKRLQRMRNLITSLKLGIFGVIVWGVVMLVQGVLPLFWVLAGVGTVAFLVLSVVDAHVVTRKTFAEKHYESFDDELRYLHGERDHLSTGSEFADPAHPYAHDLDIFGAESLFQHLNRAVTGNGARLIARWLTEPELVSQTIEKRQQAASELAQSPDFLMAFRATGKAYTTTSSDERTVAQWNALPFFAQSRKFRYGVYAANIITLIVWILYAVGVVKIGLPMLCSIGQLAWVGAVTGRINRIHRALNGFTSSLGHYRPLVELIRRETFVSSELIALQRSLCSGERNSMEGLSSLERILDAFDQRGNILVAILLDMIYTRDIHTALRLDAWRRNYGDRIEGWIDSVTRMDGLVSMAIYRCNHPGFTVPQCDDALVLEAEQLTHPALDPVTAVTNDFRVESLHRIFLVTGANMAGKSTFLRSVGVNLVLALSGNVVCAARMRFTPMQLFTSMRTTDNLSSGTSYFHAELLRLKAMDQMIDDSSRTFIILDEMLKGTNSADKLTGSIRYLTRLRSRSVAALVASHDLALGELEGEYPDNFTNVCFEIEHDAQGEIHYDYRLRRGISRNMNATLLMEQMKLI